MECFSPIRLQTGVVVPCGRCIACLKRLRSAMSFRLGQELRYSATAFFITLTYDDENIVIGDGCYTLVKKHLQDYLKRLRKISKFRYYAIGEYGSKTQRPHYHACIFNFVGSSIYFDKCWSFGMVHIGRVEPASINYMVSDMVNFNCVVNLSREASFRIMSRRPGIGYAYVEKFKTFHRRGLKGYCTLPGGVKIAMPRYYKEKVFSKFEREKMQISQKLQAQKRKEAYYDDIEKYGGGLEIDRKESVKRVFNKQSKKTKI